MENVDRMMDSAVSDALSKAFIDLLNGKGEWFVSCYTLLFDISIGNLLHSNRMTVDS